jgi:diacylglycerol kinase family enzyme
MKNALLIYNPAAGRIPVKPFIPGILRVLVSSGWQVEVAETLNGSHTTRLARPAAEEMLPLRSAGTEPLGRLPAAW